MRWRSKVKMCCGDAAPGAKSAMEFPCALRFEKLPHRANLHEFCGFGFHFFHVVEKFQRAGFAIGESFFKISAIPEMPAIEHQRIDVAPHVGKIRNLAHFAIQIRDAWNRNVGAYFRRARFACSNGRSCELHAAAVGRAISGHVVAKHRFARRGIRKMIHQAQTGHCVFRVADRLRVARRDFRAREFIGKRGSADE